MKLTFPKNEKLKSRKTIEALFSEGRSITKYPLKVFFLTSETSEITQAAFAVPKRNFKLAVTRNAIKRKIKETYRLQKQLLLANNDTKFALMFLCISKEKPQYDALEKAMTTLLKKIKDENS